MIVEFNQGIGDIATNEKLEMVLHIPERSLGEVIDDLFVSGVVTICTVKDGREVCVKILVEGDKHAH